MDATMSEEGESILDKLREKYQNRQKQRKVSKTTCSIKDLSHSSSLSYSRSTIPLRFRRKISDLLKNNSDLAKSLESARLEIARIEQENATFRQQLNNIPLAHTKLYELSSNMSEKVTLIFKSLDLIGEIRKLLSGSNIMTDTVLTTDSSTRSDSLNRKTPEEQPVPGPSFQRNVWQPMNIQKVLDMSTINEISMAEETRHVSSSRQNSDMLNVEGLRESNSDIPDEPMIITDPRIVILAESNPQHSTPENKEVEASDETPKTPILSSQKFLASQVVAKYLPFKKISSFGGDDSELPLHADSDDLSEICDAIRVKPTVTSRRRSNKMAMPCHAISVDVGLNSAISDENEKGATSDYTLTSAANNMATSSQVTELPLNRKTFIVEQPSCSKLNTFSKATAPVTKLKRSTSKKTLVKKPRRATYTVPVNEGGDQANQHVCEDTTRIVTDQPDCFGVEQEAFKNAEVSEDGVGQIQKKTSSEQTTSGITKKKVVQEGNVCTKNGKKANFQSLIPMLMETAAENPCLPSVVSKPESPANAYESAAIGKEQNSSSDACDSAMVDKVQNSCPRATNLKAMDMSLTEVIHIPATGCLPNPDSQKDVADSNMPKTILFVEQSANTHKYEDVDLRHEFATNEVASSEIVSTVKNKEEEEAVEASRANENTFISIEQAPVNRRTQRVPRLNYKLLLNSSKNNEVLEIGENSDVAQKVKEKRSEKKQKKATTSRSRNNKTDDDVAIQSKKISAKEKASSKKNEPISRPGPSGILAALDFLTLPSSLKPKSPMADIFNDSLHLEAKSPCKIEGQEQAGQNYAQPNDANPYTSSASKNLEVCLSKANKNLSDSEDDNLLPNSKRIKVEIESKNNSFAYDIGPNLEADLGNEIDLCPQPSTTSGQKESVRVTKRKKKGSSLKSKKAKAGSSAAGNQKSVGRPRAKKNEVVEKENELARTSLLDFYSPQNLKASKPPKKRGRPPKSPLKSRNTGDDHIQSSNLREAIALSPLDKAHYSQGKVDAVVEIHNLLAPVKENLGPDYLNSSFRLNSDGKTVHVTSPNNQVIELVLPQPAEQLLVNAKASTSKASKGSTRSMSTEKTRISSSILDSVPRRRKQGVSYREPSLHSKLRRP